MSARLRLSLSDLALLGAGLALAVAWPLSAYAASPAALPALLVGAVTVGAIVRRPEYGVAVALALAPVANLTIAGQRPLLILLPALVAGLAAYTLLVLPGSLRHLPAVAWTSLAFLFVVIAAGLQALVPAHALPGIIWLAVAVGLLFVILQLCYTRRHTIVIAGGLIAGLALAAAHGLVQHATGSFSQDISFVAEGEIVQRVSGAFGHPNQYAALLATTVPLALSVAAGRGLPRALRVLAVVAAALGLTALVLSYTRGAVIGLVAGGLLALMALRPRAVLPVGAVMLVAGIALAPPALQERFRAESGSDVALRADIWGASLEIYAERPVLGAGGGNFADGYRALPSTPTFSSQRRLLHNQQILVPPHAQNQFLNILAEQGTIGILAFLALAGSALVAVRRGFRSGGTAGRAICLGVGAGLMAFAIQGLLEAPLFGARLEVTLLGMIAAAGVLARLRAMTAAHARAQRRGPPPARKRRSSR